MDETIEQRVERLTALARKVPCWAGIASNHQFGVHVDTTAVAVLCVTKDEAFTLFDCCEDTEALERTLYAMLADLPATQAQANEVPGLSAALDEASGTVHRIAKALGAIEYGAEGTKYIQADDETLIESVKSLVAEQADYAALRLAAEAVLDDANARDDVENPVLWKLSEALGLTCDDDEEDADV